MKTKSKESFLSILFITALLFYAYFALEYSRKIDNVLVKTILQFSRHLIHIGLLLGWILSIRRRILHPAIRRYLLSVGTLLAFWLYIRTCKWMFFPPGACWQCRYLWYAYYIPLILIPLSGMFLALYLGKPESYRLPHNMIFACIPASLLLILVFTNDLHQLVFRFPNGFASAESDYTYGPGYFLILAWCIGLGIFFVTTLSGKCRVPGRNQGKKLPLLVLAAAVVFSVLYCLRILKFDLTAMDCLIIVLLLESCIQSGLIRSNSGYRYLFEEFSMEAQIEDDQGNLFCCSKRAARLDPPAKNWMKNPDHINKVIRTKRLRSAKIRNGHIL